MVEKVFTIVEEAGLHARPASILVQAANKFKSDVNLEYKSKSVNLKSIMGVMSLGVMKGSEIKIIASGPDENEVLTNLIDTMLTNKLINDRN